MPTNMRSYTSSVVDVSTAITIDYIDPSYPHCFGGLTFYSDSGGTTTVTPTAGSVDPDVVTINSYPNSDDVSVDPIDLSLGNFTFDWAANSKSVTVTPTGVTGAAYWSMRVTANRT